MKKGLLFLGILIFACSANAQIFVGGSVGVGFDNKKNKDGEKISQNFNVGLSPEIGYSITSKIDIGLSVGVGFQREKRTYNYWGGGKQVVKNDTLTWNVAPLLQYHFAKWGKFDFVARGVVYFGGEKETNFNSYGGMVYDKKENRYNYGLSVSPVIHYNLNDHFILLTDLNFLSLNIGGSFIKDVDRDFGFFFGANTGNALNFHRLRIGFIYKF